MLAKAALATTAAIGLGLLSLPLLTASQTSPAPTAGDIPPRVATAYKAADGWCPGLRWQLLAGIGWVESGHGTANGATVEPVSGAANPPILGPSLDGTRFQAIAAGEWQGRWGASGPWMRAIGPMQFLPSTFAAWAVDADRDGTSDPHDVDDAAATAANSLCGGRTGRIDDERSTILRYNHSDAYAGTVLAYADRLASEGRAALSLVGGDWLCPVAGPTSFINSWHAPRSGGRIHQGVDMFAARGTPTVAPVAGYAEHFPSGLGGLSFRLWGDDGNYYFGTHLDSYGPLVGHVAAGTILGYVGDTGNARGTGPHLHFEIHPGRSRGDPARAVDPTPTVAEHCARNRSGR